MNNEEILEELKRRELEILTQAEFEFDENIAPKIESYLTTEEEKYLFYKTLETIKMVFKTGVSYGFLKYIENRIEQKDKP